MCSAVRARTEDYNIQHSLIRSKGLQLVDKMHASIQLIAGNSRQLHGLIAGHSRRLGELIPGHSGGMD